MTNHPSANLDEIVHQKTRLGILAILNEAASADFRFLQESLGATAGNLSRHLDTLSGAGLVEITKSHQGKRPRTQVAITRAGKSAFKREIQFLKSLIPNDTSENDQ